MIRQLDSKEVIYDFTFDTKDVGNNNCNPEYIKSIKDIKMALNINKTGYNVYLIDEFTNNKIQYLTNRISEFYKGKESPKDICYVTYLDERKPKYMFLKSGNGNLLKATVEKLQKTIHEVTIDFYNNTTDEKKEKILQELQENKNLLLADLVSHSEKEGFDLKITQYGFSFMPMLEGKQITEKEFEELPVGRRTGLTKKMDKLKSEAKEILIKISQLENGEIEKIKVIMKEYYDTELKKERDEYTELFSDEEQGFQYLEFIYENAIKELIENYTLSYDDDEEKISEVIYRYMINVLVDNSNNEEPPVIYVEDASISNLVGTIEYENQNGNYVTDISMIKAGDILKANEGCIIIRTSNLLKYPNSYHKFKNILLNGKADISINRSSLELFYLNSPEVEPIPVNVKVLLIGDYYTYDVLFNYDEDFKHLFKIKTECNPYVELDKEVLDCFISVTNKFEEENNIKLQDNKALKELAKYLARKCEDRRKLLFDYDEVDRILSIANFNAQKENRSKISQKDILDAAYNEDLLEKEYLQEYKNHRILIETNGCRVGQINGLSVINSGYFSFGKPIKITCSCFRGEGTIVDIQKENNLSGGIHRKSVSILKGCLYNLLEIYYTLPVNFYLSFEQLYGRLEGDSASVAEFISMISALSKIPVKQNIAVTGSLDQFGNIQPIGGVNEKIEGFYKVCKLIDNVYNKGVLIPYINKDSVILNKEVEDCILRGDFKIFVMKDIRDAIEVMLCNDNLDYQGVIKKLKDQLDVFMR
ncbi:AAA family ATPase [Clostridium cellulovorans]|uniref:endopeptidase La n=1 Tax=Clostridium cellulovorans (strain ATCC 35296 / DSM 3052 / OCM 3 / 743B) TaxID=573061 RepID=D9SKJ4_CLOC7|nr:AAA family ATPase [Clostridium cellulovorans]ADL51490.1 ATP-dependent protease La [Clostridium cellulovorans 743B]